MRVLRLASMLAAIACLGAEPPVKKYPVPPPGKIVQDVVVYLSGEAMNSAWHVVTSKKLAGTFLGKPVYQWYLSIYEPRTSGLKLAYQAPPPGDNSWLPTVKRGAGKQAPYFPYETLKVVGAAELEQATVQDAVVVMHAAAADCGESIVAVLGADARTMKVTPRVTVVNSCDLNAKIVKKGDLQAVQLSGPYYANNAPLCCPTKPQAIALLTGGNGTWAVTPNYFTISASLASHM